MRELDDWLESQIERIPFSGCWIWTGASAGKGYGKAHGDYAHRLVYSLFKGAIPSGLWVLHTCDVRCCVNPGHLYLGTHEDNVIDALKRDRFNHNLGPRPWMRKLGPTDEVAVLQLLSIGLSQRRVAELMGSSQWMIWSILHDRPKRDS